MNMRKIAVSFLVLAALLSGCDGGGDETVEVSASSSDAALQAVVVTEGFGATVSEVYSVRILQRGKKPEEVMRADHVRNVTLRWSDEKHLEINMDCGRIFKYTNFFDVMDSNGKLLYAINVRLTNTSLCDL
jgi:hypothetical protein